VVKLGHS